MIGFEIPLWDEVLKTVGSAAAKIPQVQYIGWDAAITENGVVLIEGNHDPGHRVVQMIAQKGIYRDIQQIIRSDK